MPILSCPLTLRTVKGSRLTHIELDSNFLSLKNCIDTLNNSVTTNFLSISGGSLLGPLSACTGGIYTDELYSCGGLITVNSDIEINGNVTIIGSATTINTEVVQATDNIIILNLSGNTTSAENGGVVIENAQGPGTDASILFYNGCWNFDPGICDLTVSGDTFFYGTVYSGGTPLTQVINNIITATTVPSPYKFNDIESTAIEPVLGTNQSVGLYSNIGGGDGNIVLSSSTYSTIGGGRSNTITDSGNGFIGGGFNNYLKSFNQGYALYYGSGSIVGGHNNAIGSYIPTVTGVTSNYDSGASTIGGGSYNEIRQGQYWNPSTIGGGQENKILGKVVDGYLYYSGWATVGGGSNNEVYGAYGATIGGGAVNYVDRQSYTTIAGGRQNRISGYYNNSWSSVIGGGYRNIIYGAETNHSVRKTRHATIGGGFRNVLSTSNFSTIVGGAWNQITDSIVSGFLPSSNYSSNFIGGGRGNNILLPQTPTGATSVQITGATNFIGGGSQNQIHKSRSSIIVGGENNDVYSNFSSIVGGEYNTVTHDSSHIIGSNLTSVSANTTHVDRLNINEVITANTPTILLAVDSNGMVVDGSDLISSFTSGGTSSPFQYNVTETTAIEPVLGGNLSTSTYSTIGGGINNVVTGSTHSFIGGGSYNGIDSTEGNYGNNNVIVGGTNNQIGGYGYGNNFIGGGGEYVYGAYGIGNVISGGSGNVIVGGGIYGGNSIINDTYLAFIGGGYYNTIDGGDYSSIVGGESNSILNNRRWNFIGGGRSNTINSQLAFIGGGRGNTINQDGFFISTYSSIIGGRFNTNNHVHSHIIGSNITSVSANTTHVEKLNIKTLNNTPIVVGLGIDANGMVVSGATGTISPFEYNTSTTNAIQPVLGTNVSDSTYSIIAGGFDNTINPSTNASAIGGGRDNTVYSSARYSTIGGGQTNKIFNGWHSTIGGGAGNTISAFTSTIGGGFNNLIGITQRSAIGGGEQNMIYSPHSFIGGGEENTVYSNSSHSFIGSGRRNDIHSNTTYAIVGGGYKNIIQSGSSHSLINGGSRNYIYSNSQHSIIGGGFDNHLYGSDFSIINGGRSNIIESNSNDSVIGGGRLNRIYADGRYSTIAGGTQNKTYSEYSTIVGGSLNTIESGSIHSMIVGGRATTIKTGSTTSLAIGPYHVIHEDSPRSFVGGFSNSIYSNIIGGTIVGGFDHSIRGISDYPTIIGGSFNTIGTFGYITGSSHSIIVGGFYNTIEHNSEYSSILGGQFNTNNHTNSHIIGSNITSVSANTTHVERFNIGLVDTSVTSTEVLVREANGMVNVVDLSTLTGGTTSNTLVDLTDTTITTPTDGDYLVYSGGTWINREEQEIYFVATTSGQTIFNGVLPTTPLDVTKSKMFVNGVKQRYGSSHDFIITGGTDVVWTSTKHNIITTDELNITYI